MGMSFIISRNMDGDTTGSQLLGNRGSHPLSTTLRSSIQRLKDSRGGSMPVGRESWLLRTWSGGRVHGDNGTALAVLQVLLS